MDKYNYTKVIKNLNISCLDIIDSQKDDLLKNALNSIEKEITYSEWGEICSNVEEMDNVKQELLLKIINNTRLQKDIITYIYWEYKHPDSTKKINITKLKKAFKIKSNESIRDYIKGIEYNIKCPICNKIGTLEIKSYDYNNASFICNNCNHEDRNNTTTDKTYYYCKCDTCENIRKEIISRTNNWLEDLWQNCCDIVENGEEIFGIIPDEDMQSDYKIYSASPFDKDVREILQFCPKNMQKLDEIIKKIVDSKGRYGRKYKENIYKKLVKHKLIYKIRVKKAFTPIQLFTQYLSPHSTNLHDQILNRFNTFKKDLSKDSLSFIKGATIHTIYVSYPDRKGYDYYYDYWVTGDVNKYSFEDILRPIDRTKLINYLYEDKYILNNYYFGLGKIEDNVEKQHFNSLAEKNLYQSLRNEYSNYRIESNVELARIIDMDKINELFKPKHANYINSCVVDFVIYNNNQAFKVIELQKGGHHNDPQWMYKDNLKKYACLICGLIFEEKF